MFLELQSLDCTFDAYSVCTDLLFLFECCLFHTFEQVFDMAFSRDKEEIASVGADGSVRMFDLRSLEHSTIIYETPDLVPLL